MVGGLSLLDEADAAWREEYRLSPARRVAKVEDDCACEECIWKEYSKIITAIIESEEKEDEITGQ